MTPAIRSDLDALAHRLLALVDALLVVYAPPDGDTPSPVVLADVAVIRRYYRQLQQALAENSNDLALRAVNVCQGINKGLTDDGLLQDPGVDADVTAILVAVVPLARALRADLGMAF